MKNYILAALFCMFYGEAFSATFTSAGTGSWNTPATWSVVGADADGIPDSNDDVTIAGSFTVTLTVANNSCRDFTINSGTFALGNRTLRFYGNVLKTGGTISGVGSWLFYSASGTIQGTFVNQGNWFFTLGSNTTIIAGSNIQKNNGFTIYQNAVVTNNGSVRLTGGTITFNHPSGQWINAANSTLLVSASFSGAGTLNFSASPNTMIYQAAATTQVRANTYHHLTIQNTIATVPFLTGNITVNGNMTLTSTTLNCNNFNITLAGNWVNNANTTCTNQNTITFNGTGTQTISRGVGTTETFNQVNITGFGGTVLLADSLIVNGLLNITAGTLDVSASNYNIHCRSSFFDNSIFTCRQGTVFFDGAAAQAIDGASSTLFYNLTTSNGAGVTVSFIKQVSNILNVAAGNFGPSAFGTVILTATGSTTCARIAPLGATGSLSGTNWQIQTFINGPATAYWQYLGSPVISSTIADWDGDTRFYMSGVGGNDGNACCPIFRSVRTYNTASNTYTNVTNTGTALTPGLGFMVWMSDNMTNLASPLIYDTRGTPNSNTVNRAVVSGGAGAGYNLVSNPYACPVNWASVVAASSATLNPSFLILQENGSYATDPNGGTIAGGQGFMCVATTSANMTFTESCKSIVANPNVIRQAAPGQVRIKVGNQVNGLGEETVVRLTADGDESYDAMIDLAYLPSPYDNATHIWTQNSNGEQFLLNNLSISEDHLMIPVSVVTSTPGMQTLTFKDMNTVTEYNCAWLEDLTTGARINLNSTDTYAFNEDEMGATRNFILHFERTSDCSFDLQNSTTSLEAASNVFVNNGQIYAQFEFETEEAVTISMYDLGGRMVMGETTMNVTQQTISLTNPDAHGIYLVRIQKGNEITTKKIYY